MTEKLRAMLLSMFNRQMRSDVGISTRTNLYMVEVQLLEDYVNVITGNAQVYGDHYDLIHDLCCDFIDDVHKYDQ
jgi:hypothetical protein